MNMPNPKGVARDRDTSKTNHLDAEKEALEEKRQQEIGRDTKPGGIDKDKMRRPGNR
jgi:hypothetical protein